LVRRRLFPAEPTRLRVRAGRGSQGRPFGRFEEVALKGAEVGARLLRLQFMLDLISIAATQRYGPWWVKGGSCCAR
jgi:hypothetical protein